MRSHDGRPDDDALIRAALARVLPGLDGDVRYRPLAGGINKRSFLVWVREQQCVLQFPVAGTSGLLDLATEARVMESAAAAGLAPRVLGVDAASGVLLTEYRAGALPWTAAATREPDNIVRGAQLLRSLHRVPVALPKLVAAAVAARYIDALGHLQPKIATWAQELTSLAVAYDTRYAATVLCHNDLVASNVLDDGGLALIDFEYSVGGAPILDLASLAGMNDFIPRQRRALLEAYYRGSIPFTEAEFDDIVRMVRLMALFWALLGERRVEDPVAYRQFAQRMIEALK